MAAHFLRPSVRSTLVRPFPLWQVSGNTFIRHTILQTGSTIVKEGGLGGICDIELASKKEFAPRHTFPLPNLAHWRGGLASDVPKRHPPFRMRRFRGPAFPQVNPVTCVEYDTTQCVKRPQITGRGDEWDKFPPQARSSASSRQRKGRQSLALKRQLITDYVHSWSSI